MAKKPTDLTEAEIQQAQQPATTVAPAAAPAPQPITEAMALQFIFDGRQRLTAVWLAMRSLKEWSETFDQRGGSPTFGDDALAIVYFNNDLQAIIDDTKRATIARLRTDI